MTRSDDPDPKNHIEALSSPDANKWDAAMKAELTALKTKAVFTLVPPPDRPKTVIGSKWVLTRKRDAEGNVTRYKARLVAQGFSQRSGDDYSETFSPVTHITTIRLFFALAALNKWVVHSIDVKTAYLNGPIQEELYMRQPPGFEDSDKPHYVWRLQKALYGLKQAGRAWNEELDRILLTFGLSRCTQDTCLYFTHIEGNLIVVIVYVDDLLFGSSSENAIQKLKSKIASTWDIVDNGLVTSFLGMKITQLPDHSGYRLSQPAVITNLLEQYNLVSCRPANTPMDPSSWATLAASSSEFHDPEAYRSLIGSLMWLTNCTRPDLAFTVGFLARFMQNPTSDHWQAALQVVRYLAGTKQLGLVYSSSGNGALIGFTDSDWASDKLTRRSTTGYVFLLAGAAISWKSKLQKTVACSSMEAEYMALFFGVSEAIHLRSLLAEIGMQVQDPTRIFCDSQSAIAISKNPEAHQRTKHIDVKYHKIRETIKDKIIDLNDIASEDQVADGFTKPENGVKIRRTADSLGLIQ